MEEEIFELRVLSCSISRLNVSKSSFVTGVVLAADAICSCLHTGVLAGTVVGIAKSETFFILDNKAGHDLTP